MLEEHFKLLLQKFTSNDQLISEGWNEVNRYYNGKKRYYHNFHHLENMLTELSQVKSAISNWDTLIFSLFYHDIIYNPTRSNNEVKSAELAQRRMRQLLVPTEMIDLCVAQILATKLHQPTNNSDINYFTDADLCILGQDWETYTTYFQQIRKEYSIYPDFIYNPGRKKVLQHFIAMKQIFKTTHFHKSYEVKAKQNLQKELEQLG